MKQSDNRLKKNMPIYLLRSTRKLQAHTHATMEGKLFNSTHDWEKDNTRASSVAKKFGKKWIPKGIPGEERVRRMKALDKAQALTKVLRSKLEKNPKWIHASTLIKLQKALSTAIRKTNTGLDVCLALAGFEEVSGKKWTYMDEKECESKWDYVSEDSGSDEDPADYETPDEKESDNESEKSEDAPSDEEESAEESDCSEQEEESEPEDEDEDEDEEGAGAGGAEAEAAAAADEADEAAAEAAAVSSAQEAAARLEGGCDSFELELAMRPLSAVRVRARVRARARAGALLGLASPSPSPYPA